jgi:hypothetical protein
MSISVIGKDGLNLATVANAVPVYTGDAETPASVGSVRMMCENDPGTITGEVQLRSPEISQDYRMRVGVDTLLFTDTFNATAQNTATWKHTFTTMTMTQSAGFLNINAAGNSTVASNSAFLQTCRYFPLLGTAPLSVEFTGQITALPGANEIFLAGLGVAQAAAEPVDGVWLELSSNGLQGVIRYNSGVTAKTELVSAANMASMPLNTNAKYVMVVGERGIDWWIDDVLYGTTELPAANGQPFMTTALPVFLQKYNSGTVGSSPNMIIKVGDVSVLLSDLNANQTWANQMASCGLGLQGLNGGTMGSPQVQWANTALPTAAAATNTTAALGAFLGGIFAMNAPATSATDVIVASYQNPLGGVSQTPRTMKLRGIKIDCVNTVAAVATTASTFAVALAWGGSALSLATAESASFVNNTAKARRIQPLGVISFPVGAAIGAAASPLQFDFEAPIVVNPGEFVQVIVKILVGTATATEVFQWIVSPNLYHE